jgi:hypothetical protein
LNLGPGFLVVQNGSRVIEIIVELVLSFVWEILLQIVGELFVELGLRSVRDSFRQRGRAHPALAALGVIVLGGVGGVLTSVIWPTRVFAAGPLPGVSLLMSPLLSGLAMESLGRWKEGRGQARSYISTYWGGALFAFAMALVRFLWVGA